MSGGGGGELERAYRIQGSLEVTGRTKEPQNVYEGQETFELEQESQMH